MLNVTFRMSEKRDDYMVGMGGNCGCPSSSSGTQTGPMLPVCFLSL